MKRAIVSGPTGAIGTALIEELTSRGIEVLAIVRPDSKRKDNIPCNSLTEVLEAGFSDYSTVSNSSGKKYDVFYHLAWEGAAGPGRHDMYLQNQNVKYALDAVGMAQRFGCTRFIGAGSQAEYGRVDRPLTSHTPTFPEMGYGYAKLCASQMTREYASQIGMEHIWVRILSVYGPNDGKQSMIMSVISQLKAGKKPELTKGEQMWDYLFSEDAAEAFAMLGEQGISGKTYVLGSGNIRQLREYIQELRDIVAPGAELNLGAVPYGEKQVMFLGADISEIYKDTGWRPRTSFAEGVEKLLSFERSESNRL